MSVIATVGLIVWLLPAVVVLVGSQLAPIPDQDRIRTPREVLAVLGWPILAAVSLVRTAAEGVLRD